MRIPLVIKSKPTFLAYTLFMKRVLYFNTYRLLSNMVDGHGVPLGGAAKYLVLNHEDIAIGG